MLAPYARRLPPRPPCAIDRWLGPGWTPLERHELPVAASPDAALRALMSLRIRELAAVRALFALRRLPFSPEMTLREFFSTSPFVMLEEDPGRELVGGVLVPPRDAGAGGRRRLPESASEFRRMLDAAPVAAIATFRSEPAEGGAHLWTETWVRATGTARPAFAAYWLAIGPWSAWIRRLILGAARRRAEGG